VGASTRKPIGAHTHHRDLRNRAQSVHGAKIFPCGGFGEAQAYRCPAFDELSLLGSPESSGSIAPSSNDRDTLPRRYVCGG
jgi:hypothetical protein